MESMTKPRFKRRWSIVLLVLCVVTIGATVLLQWAAFCKPEWDVDAFVHACARNELRVGHFAESNLKFFWTDADYDMINIELSTGKVVRQWCRSIPFDGFNSMGPWALTQVPPSGYSQSQREEIGKVLSTLPTTTNSLESSYRYQVHVAFWRDGHLCLYNYPVDDRAKLRGLATVLGMEQAFERRDSHP